MSNNTDTLPMPVANALANLETRHKRHQQMLTDHWNEKHDRRDRHRARSYQRKIIPILFT